MGGSPIQLDFYLTGPMHQRSPYPRPPTIIIPTSLPSTRHRSIHIPRQRGAPQAGCPRSLLTGLHPTHPDRDTWMASFCEEESRIESQNTYIKINLAEYHALCAKGAPRAIPTMCVLSIKKDEMLNPLRAKSRILVLGNHEDCVWTKSEKYAPVL